MGHGKPIRSSKNAARSLIAGRSNTSSDNSAERGKESFDFKATPIRAFTLASFRHLVSTVLVPQDYSNFMRATGTNLMLLLDLIGVDHNVHALVGNITGNIRLIHPHPLNAYGLHPFRALMAERLSDHIRAAAKVDTDIMPLAQRLNTDGFVVIPLTPAEDFRMEPGGLVSLGRKLKRTLQAISGWKHQWFRSRMISFNVHTHYDGDVQQYAHVDTHTRCLKAFLFRPNTTLASGPFFYANGSHTNSDGKLRWLFDRTRHLIGGSMPPDVTAITHAPVGPYSDWTHGVEEAIRFEGFMPRGPPAGRDWSYDFHRYDLSPPLPVVLPASLVKHKATLIIADTNGIHHRGWAPPGTMRVGTGLHEDGRRNAWNCFQRLERWESRC